MRYPSGGRSGCAGTAWKRWPTRLTADLVFSCRPGDLEKYSDDPRDLARWTGTHSSPPTTDHSARRGAHETGHVCVLRGGRLPRWARVLSQLREHHDGTFEECGARLYNEAIC